MVGKRLCQVRVLGVEPFLRAAALKVNCRPRHLAVPSNFSNIDDAGSATEHATVLRPKRGHPPTNCIHGASCRHGADAAPPPIPRWLFSMSRSAGIQFVQTICFASGHGVSSSLAEVGQVFPVGSAFPRLDPLTIGVLRSSCSLLRSIGSVIMELAHAARADGLAQPVSRSAPTAFKVNARRQRRGAFIAPLHSPKALSFAD